MYYKIVIPHRFASLNEYIGQLGRNPKAGGRMKRDDCGIMIMFTRKCLRGVKIKTPIVIHYAFYEPNTKRDRQNVSSYFDKCYADCLQKSGFIRNDGWNDIYNITHDFFVDKRNPRVEIVIEEVSEDIPQFDWNKIPTKL